MPVAKVHAEGNSVGEGGLFLSDFTRLITQADNTQKLHHNGRKGLTCNVCKLILFYLTKHIKKLYNRYKKEGAVAAAPKLPKPIEVL